MTNDFYSAVKNRRSIYAIGKEVVISDEKILEIVEHAVLHTPSAFNSQSARVIVLLGDHHEKLWNIIKETLLKLVPEVNFESIERKTGAFRSGYGTILFFEDNEVVENLQRKFPIYADRFSVCSQQSNGMLQYVIWTSLELEGLGASLQHYNPSIDDEVKEEWGIPASWHLIAQMPFGHVLAPAGEKQFQPIEERVKLYK